MTELVVDWCSYKAAKYAVMHWHYSKTMPAGKLVKLGAWENEKFIGCVLFGRGAIHNIGKPYGLTQTECVELVRVALQKHKSPTTSVVAQSLKLAKQHNPGLRLIVSYADSGQGHVGTIYQAGNWVFVGSIHYRAYYMLSGQTYHGRTLYSRYGTQSLEWLQKHVDPKCKIVMNPPKHKYLYPLDRAMRRQIGPLAKPYPKAE